MQFTDHLVLLFQTPKIQLDAIKQWIRHCCHTFDKHRFEINFESIYMLRSLIGIGFGQFRNSQLDVCPDGAFWKDGGNALLFTIGLHPAGAAILHRDSFIRIILFICKHWLS
jgi:hypothetical protein